MNTWQRPETNGIEMSYLIDSNILIYFFNGVANSEKLDSIFVDNFNISVISRIEFLGWSKFAEDPNLNSKALEFMQYATIYDLNDVIADKTIEIRREFKIKMPDAIIAATAMTNNHILVTNNEADFINVDVELFNPMS